MSYRWKLRQSPDQRQTANAAQEDLDIRWWGARQQVRATLKQRAHYAKRGLPDGGTCPQHEPRN